MSQGRDGGGWGWLMALVTVPVLCCAGPGVLAALGVGTVGALLGAAVRNGVLLAPALVVVLAAAAVVLARRRRGRR